MRSPAPENAHTTMPVHVPRWAFHLVTVASLLLGATSIVRGTQAVATIADSDLTNYFLKSVDDILRGAPWQMYAVRADLIHPNYNPPLGMFLMAPLLWLARTVGFAANYGEQITFVTLPFIVLVPLMGYLALRVMDRLHPDAPEAQRLLVYALITLSPLTWQTYSIWYHVEQPLMLCLLIGAVMALQSRREGLAGLLAGLAVLSRMTALLPLLALIALLLLTRQWRPLVKFGGVSGLVTVLGFAPFFLFDSADAMYTFVSWRGSAPVGNDSIWALFAYPGASSGPLHLLDALARRLDVVTVILLAVVVAIVAVRRLRLNTSDADVWGLVAIATLATPMLSKQVWPYFYLEPFVMIAVWELASLHDRVAGLWRWPVLSVAFMLVAATLSQYIGLRSVGRLDSVALGVTQTALMAGFALAIWARMGAKKPASEVNGAMTPPRGAVAQAAMSVPVAPVAPVVGGGARAGNAPYGPREALPLTDTPAQVPGWGAAPAQSAQPIPPAPASTPPSRQPVWPVDDAPPQGGGPAPLGPSPLWPPEPLPVASWPPGQQAGRNETPGSGGWPAAPGTPDTAGDSSGSDRGQSGQGRQWRR